MIILGEDTVEGQHQGTHRKVKTASSLYNNLIRMSIRKATANCLLVVYSRRSLGSLYSTPEITTANNLEHPSNNGHGPL